MRWSSFLPSAWWGAPRGSGTRLPLKDVKGKQTPALPVCAGSQLGAGLPLVVLNPIQQGGEEQGEETEDLSVPERLRRELTVIETEATGIRARSQPGGKGTAIQMSILGLTDRKRGAHSTARGSEAAHPESKLSPDASMPLTGKMVATAVHLTESAFPRGLRRPFLVLSEAAIAAALCCI